MLSEKRRLQIRGKVVNVYSTEDLGVMLLI